MRVRVCVVSVRWTQGRDVPSLPFFSSSFYPEEGGSSVRTLALRSPRWEPGLCADWFVFFSFKLVSLFSSYFFGLSAVWAGFLDP